MVSEGPLLLTTSNLYIFALCNSSPPQLPLLLSEQRPALLPVYWSDVASTLPGPEPGFSGRLSLQLCPHPCSLPHFQEASQAPSAPPDVTAFGEEGETNNLGGHPGVSPCSAHFGGLVPLSGEAEVRDLEHRVREVVVLDGLQNEDCGIRRRGHQIWWAADCMSWPCLSGTAFYLFSVPSSQVAGLIPTASRSTRLQPGRWEAQ